MILFFCGLGEAIAAIVLPCIHPWYIGNNRGYHNYYNFLSFNIDKLDENGDIK
jgi:hypothetical protein